MRQPHSFAAGGGKRKFFETPVLLILLRKINKTGVSKKYSWAAQAAKKLVRQLHNYEAVRKIFCRQRLQNKIFKTLVLFILLRKMNKTSVSKKHSWAAQAAKKLVRQPQFFWSPVFTGFASQNR